MAELRCQLCGKTNPDHLELCQHCGARLTPMFARDEDSGANWADASQEDTLGWLRSIGQEGDEAGDSDSSDDLPDWMGGSSEEDAESPSADWMNEIGTGGVFASSESSEQNPLDSPDTGAGFDDWMPVGEEDSGLQDNDLNDFLSQPGTAEEDAGEPSWLSAERGEEKTIPISDLPGGSFSDEDDWLNSIGPEDSLTATVVDWKQPSSSSEGTDDLPGWLQSSPSEPSQPESGNFDDDLPSWLSGESDSPPQSEPTSDTSSTADFDGEFPDWLDSLESKTGMTGKLGDMPQWIDESEPSDSGQDSSIDWLASLGDTPEEETTEDNWEQGTETGSLLGRESMGGLAFGPEDSFIADFGGDETPDWLQGLQDSDPGYTEPSSGDLSSSFQSSWGFDSPPQEDSWESPESDLDEEPVPSIEDSSIPGILPSWITAFRPMDGADVATEHVEGELERVGPLAGLRDLLTPEADIAKTTKPPSYSDVLQVSSTQQTNAQLLQALVESENIPQPIPDTSPLSSQWILRIVFGAILILLMLFPLISGTQNVPLPQTLPQEMQSIMNLSNEAPLDRPILVAFDYEPGTSGEMEAATKVLFDHWMDRGVPLALVSTSPSGAGLGERQVAYLQSQFLYDHHYIYGENYVNLGYIAGGTAGLANFALFPDRSLQVAFDNRPIWELFDFKESNPWLTAVMQPINGLSDFFMTVLLTDNPETARNWLEQVKPALRSNSMVIVASAQAEPFIRPYFQNPDSTKRQVEGLLVGLRGGAAYEQQQGQPGSSRLYWDTFGIGLLVAVALILVGSGYNYLDELRKSQRRARKSKGIR